MNKSQVEEMLFCKQMHALNTLKTEITSIRKAMTQLENKIQNEGIEGYYSSNHDVLKHAERIWKASNVLGELKQIVAEINT
tara:strand:- start:227 stop:469 length:243 start_codon:yes stop_codon:yes gene_type:complete